MKKLLTVLCTLLISLSVVSFRSIKRTEAETCPFTDISNTTEKPELRDAVTYLYCNGITSGTSGTTFGTNLFVTRAEFVTFLWKMAGSPDVTASNPFSDVYTYNYYYKAVLWAVANNVTSGREPGKFAPKENVTYQEVFAFIHFFSSRVVGRENAVRRTYALSSPSNLSKYNQWARSHASWAYSNGIVYHAKLYSNLFNPKDSATRGDVAMFLYNYYRSFQNRYALVGGNVNPNCGGAGNYGSGQKTLAKMKYLFLDTLKIDSGNFMYLDSIPKANVLGNGMYDVYHNSTCIDICYLYLHSHGDTEGMKLYYDGTKLTPPVLYNMVSNYKGHFVIMLEACYTGVFVNYFNSKGQGRFDVLTAADSQHTSKSIIGGLGTDNQGVPVATYYWIEYIKNNINSSSKAFMSLNEVWSDTRQNINDYAVAYYDQVQNPSIYVKKSTYIAFTKKF